MTMFPFNVKGTSSQKKKQEFTLDSVIEEIHDIAIANKKFFSNSKQPFFERYRTLCEKLVTHTDAIAPLTEQIQNSMHLYDYENVNANGYRSIVDYYKKAAVKTSEVLHEINDKKNAISFNLQAAYFFKEIEAWTGLLEVLQKLMSVSVELMKLSNSNLFTYSESLPAQTQQHAWDIVTSSSAYGRTLGFQFGESLEIPLTAVVLALASYFESYAAWKTLPAQTAFALFHTPKFFNPELRAAKVSHIFHNAGFQFCKSFYNLTENALFNFSNSLMTPEILLNKTFVLPSTSIEVETHPEDSREFSTSTINPSDASLQNPVQVRLLSNLRLHKSKSLVDFLSVSSESKKEEEKPNLSNNLLFHLHGGGFIAMSSKSHEVYLKVWAKELNVPILSVDYSLAPDYPFPNALTDCVYAYVWTLQHAKELGWNGKYITFVGDSAGANLIVALTLKLISKSIRKPDALICFYPVFNLQLDWSPSRLLSFADVLLNAEMLVRFDAAYAGVKLQQRAKEAGKTSSTKRNIERALTDNIVKALKGNSVLSHPFFSPYCASEELLKQLPPTYITACHNDPLLDDSIEFAKRLKKLHVLLELDVVSDVSHGFLNFHVTSKDCQRIFEKCTQKLKTIISNIEKDQTN